MDVIGGLWHEIPIALDGELQALGVHLRAAATHVGHKREVDQLIQANGDLLQFRIEQARIRTQSHLMSQQVLTRLQVCRNSQVVRLTRVHFVGKCELDSILDLRDRASRLTENLCQVPTAGRWIDTLLVNLEPLGFSEILELGAVHSSTLSHPRGHGSRIMWPLDHNG